VVHVVRAGRSASARRTNRPLVAGDPRAVALRSSPPRPGCLCSCPDGPCLWHHRDRDCVTISCPTLLMIDRGVWVVYLVPPVFQFVVLHAELQVQVHRLAEDVVPSAGRSLGAHEHLGLVGNAVLRKFGSVLLEVAIGEGELLAMMWIAFTWLFWK